MTPSPHFTGREMKDLGHYPSYPKGLSSRTRCFCLGARALSRFPCDRRWPGAPQSRAAGVSPGVGRSSGGPAWAEARSSRRHGSIRPRAMS